MKVHEIELKPATVLPIYNPNEREKYEGWLIAPCAHTRDSDLVEECNHAVGLEMLVAVDPDGNDHETLRFGHWAVGWIEEVLVRPGTPAHLAAQEMAAALADYPILSDDRHSAMEYEAHEARECGEYCSSCEHEKEDRRVLIHEVTDRLRALATGQLVPDGGDCDVRFQLHEDGQWAFHWGPSDYDQDHRGYWGAGSVSHGDNYASIAEDLVDQALDARAEDS